MTTTPDFIAAVTTGSTTPTAAKVTLAQIAEPVVDGAALVRAARDRRTWPATVDGVRRQGVSDGEIAQAMADAPGVINPLRTGRAMTPRANRAHAREHDRYCPDDPDHTAKFNSIGTKPTEPTADKPTGAKLSWRDVVKVHPAADLFPLMSPDELKEMADDIKANGLRERVVMMTGPGGERLMDGRNRFDALELAGVKTLLANGRLRPKHIRWVSENEVGDPYAFVASLNVHRRHLTAEQKREVIAKLLKAMPEKSNRQIAEQVKTDHKKVGRVRHSLEATGAMPQLTKTTGKDGKARPVRAKPKPAPRVTYYAEREDGTPTRFSKAALVRAGLSLPSREVIEAMDGDEPEPETERGTEPVVVMAAPSLDQRAEAVLAELDAIVDALQRRPGSMTDADRFSARLMAKATAVAEIGQRSGIGAQS